MIKVWQDTMGKNYIKYEEERNIIKPLMLIEEEVLKYVAYYGKK